MTEPPRERDSEPDPAAPGGTEPLDFDPYRFGKPDHPVPPEYAPPGYTPPQPSAPPPGSAPPPPQWPPVGPSSSSAPPPPYGAYPPQPPYGGQPYQQPGYGGYRGSPVPPPGYQYGTVKTGNTKATVAMVLGILSIVFCWLSIFDLLLIVPAIVLGALARGDAKRFPDRGGSGPAMTGIICGIVGIVLAASLTVIGYAKVKDCISDYDMNSAAFNSCVHDKLYGD